jgi:hypothetical protein
MPMTFQGRLAGGYRDQDQRLMREMLKRDPELLYLGLGPLFGYAP